MDLINFYTHNLRDDVLVADGTLFSSNVWRIQWSPSEHIKLNFESIKLESEKLTDYPELLNFAKILTYYCFPKKVYLDISSWLSTKALFSAIRKFIIDFCYFNHLVTAKMLSSTTSSQICSKLRTIIDGLELNVSGSTHSYKSFTRIMERWTNLSERKLLPPDYSLDINLESILTKKIRTKCIQLIEAQEEKWQPISPDVVEQGYKEAYRYIYEYSDCIIDCHRLIQERPTVGISKESKAPVRKDGRTKKIYKELLEKKVPFIDGETKLFNFVAIKKKVKSKGYARGWQYRETINITEVRPEVIQLKRSCVFIIALFTGMRRREIAELKAKAAYKRNGDWYLSIVRFKTSDDPSASGEEDDIPVPDIVRDAIEVLLKLFQYNRDMLDSDYLLLSDIVTKKRFEKIKIDTISRDIKEFIFSITNEDIHAHQARKTIAWLIISRSEDNIDLIRQLFGHNSFGMTMEYILRNELLVSSVIELLEHDYTEELHDALLTISEGKAIGDLATKVKQRSVNHRFKGQILVTEIETFIREALMSGVPVFVSRLPIGGFCIKFGDKVKLPPCMKNTGAEVPTVEFCDYKHCEHVLHSEESIKNIKSQITYYQTKMSYLPESSSERLHNYYETQIIEHQDLLKKLSENELNQSIKRMK